MSAKKAYTTRDHQAHEAERYDPVSAQYGHTLTRCTYPAFRRAVGLSLAEIAVFFTDDGSDPVIHEMMDCPENVKAILERERILQP